MKKIRSLILLITAVALTCLGQSVYTSVFGVTKVEKPGDSKLNVMGITFVNTSNTLNKLVDISNFSGDAANPSAADQVITWDSNSQKYTTYALYEIAGYPEYTGWKLYDEFSFGATNQNPVLPAGSAVFIRGSGSDTNIILSGSVVMLDSVTNSIVTGLQLISNPFSGSVHLTNLTFAANGTTSSSNPSFADQIILWDASQQKYITLALYGITGYPEYTQWMYFDDFAYGAQEPDITFEPGSGFWYRAQTNFTWVETNKYIQNL
jgi:hypothetical protein